MNTENKVTIPNPGIIPTLLYEDKKLTSWIYANIAKPLNIGGREYDIDFITDQLDRDGQEIFMNVYLNFMVKTFSNEEDKDAFTHSLQSDDKEGFDAQKVLISASDLLTNHFSAGYKILDIFRGVYVQKNTNELEKQLNDTFFKSFCDGLSLNRACRTLFYLCLINSVYKWIFPNPANVEYNARIFCWLLDDNVKSEIDFSRKINNQLIEKGLFSEQWIIQDFIVSAFTGKIKNIEISRVNWPSYGDIYDYQKIYDENYEEAHTSFNLLHGFTKNHSNCIQLISAPEDSRAELFLNNNLSRINRKLYEIKPKAAILSKEELNFYIYLYSLTLSEEHSVIFINESISSKLCKQNTQERNVIRISNSETEPQITAKPLLNFITVPIFIYTKSVNKETIDSFKESGINPWNTLSINFSDSAINEQNPMNYFITLRKVFLFKPVCDFVLSRKLDPFEWPRIVNLAQSATFLSVEEFQTILSKNYPDTHNRKLRKNLHYSFDALNISVPPAKLLSSIKKAVALQKIEYNADSGYRLVFTGPSGTGKTSIVEEIAKENNAPLKIVTASDFLGPYVGETEQNIRKIFEEAAESHSFLLVDEADSMIHSRGDSVNKHNDIKVNEFITQMEKFPGVLFCSTNYPEILDKATDRRFDLRVEFKPLTKEGINKLVETYFAKYKLNQKQINQIYESGDVTPGDFNVINRQIRFMDEIDITSDFITKNLCNIVSKKIRSNERKIGF
ncbi:MAG: ATP-binding protein [Treponema sp.]|nr:ATP-binding protein [Treponema sp.]